MCYDAVPFWPITEQLRIHSFHSFSSTATSTATSEYGAIPERPVELTDRAGEMGNELRTPLVPGEFPSQMKRSKLTCLLIFISVSPMFFPNTFQTWKIPFICYLYQYSLGRRGNKHFDVHFWQKRPVHFSSNDGKCLWGKSGMEGCFFCPQRWHFYFIVNIIKVLFPVYTFIWRVTNCVSRKGKGMKRRNDGTIK